MTLDSKPSIPKSTPPFEFSADGFASLVPMLKRLGLRILRRRWKALFLGLAGVFALAVLVTLLGTRRNWEATAILLYTPLPVPQDFQGLYQPPEMSSAQSLAVSRAVLEKLKTDFELPVPLKTLRKLIRVEPAFGSENMLEISLQWGNPKEAAAMVDLLASRFPEEVARVRRQALNSYYRDLGNHLRECDTRLTAARKRLADYSMSQNVIDADADMDSLQDEINYLEEFLSKTQRQGVEFTAQSNRLAAHIKDLKDQEAEKSREAEQYEAAHESVADARRRQDRLRELIFEERRVMEVKAQLEAKRHEYERAVVLLKKHTIPKARFEQVQGEMESLIARIKENESILKWKSELERIDKTVVPKGSAKRVGSPIVAQVLFKKLELDLQMLGVEKKLFELQKALAAKRFQREKLIRQRHEFQNLEDDVETINDERRAVEDRLAVLRTLRSLGPVEFSVISPAKAGEHAVKTNRKILFSGVFVLGATLLVVGLVGFEIQQNGLMAIDDVLPRLGLTKLGEIPTAKDAHFDASEGGTPDGRKAVRQLALQIRQAITKPDSLIIFSQLDDGGNSPALLAELARCFARRDERVLIWAANDSPDRQKAFVAMIDFEDAATGREPPGLADYLTFVCMELDEFIFPTHTPGVDCLVAGRSELPSEGFATHRTNELLVQLRAKYSMILVDGPVVNREDDLELLAACCDGIIFLAHDARSISPRAGEAIQNLVRFRAPIIGAVVT